MGAEQEIWNNTVLVIDIHAHDIFVIRMSFHVNNTGTMQNIKAYFVEQKIQVR
jgi:hypothetical protein